MMLVLGGKLASGCLGTERSGVGENRLLGEGGTSLREGLREGLGCWAEACEAEAVTNRTSVLCCSSRAHFCIIVRMVSIP